MMFWAPSSVKAISATCLLGLVDIITDFTDCIFHLLLSDLRCCPLDDCCELFSEQSDPTIFHAACPHRAHIDVQSERPKLARTLDTHQRCFVFLLIEARTPLHQVSRRAERLLLRTGAVLWKLLFFGSKQLQSCCNYKLHLELTDLLLHYADTGAENHETLSKAPLPCSVFIVKC